MDKCAVCHQENGLGLKNEDSTGAYYLYPPLWGDDSYNTGTGMYRLIKAASYIKENMAASFQNRVVQILVKKTMKALKDNNVKNLIVAGGVAANKGLRTALTEACNKANINLIIPEMKYCTDNAAMIGAAGYYAYKRGDIAGLDLNAKAIVSLK